MCTCTCVWLHHSPTFLVNEQWQLYKTTCNLQAKEIWRLTVWKGGVDKGEVGAGCVVAGVLPEDHTLGHHLQCTLQTPLTNQLTVLLSRTLVGEGVERLEEIVLGQVGGAYLNHANVI